MEANRFRFRAWDYFKGEMIYSNRFDNLGLFFQDIYIRRIHGNKVDVMQSTGLCDSEGKECFDGDIIYSDSWNPKVYEVIFNRGGFCFYNENIEIDLAHDIKYLDMFKIIGNKFENHELLEVPSTK